MRASVKEGGKNPRPTPSEEIFVAPGGGSIPAPGTRQEPTPGTAPSLRPRLEIWWQLTRFKAGDYSFPVGRKPGNARKAKLLELPS